MGRVRNRGPFLDGTEPVEGVDTENKVFFEKPILTLVGKAEVEPPYVSRHQYSNQQPVIEKSALITPVRLKSSYIYGVCQTRPTDVLYGATLSPTYKEIQDYLAENRIKGYGCGAVVARRWQLEWRFNSVPQWGVIKYEIGNSLGAIDWAPYRVMWFEDAHGIDREEKAWAEDLVIIHAAMADSYLKDMLEEQGLTFKFKFGSIDP